MSQPKGLNRSQSAHNSTLAGLRLSYRLFIGKPEDAQSMILHRRFAHLVALFLDWVKVITTVYFYN